MDDTRARRRRAAQKRADRQVCLLGALFSLGLLSACAAEPPRPNGLEHLRGSAPRENKAAEQTQAEQKSAYDSVMRVATQAEKSRDLNTAMGLYQRAHDLDPSRPEPLLRLAALNEDLGQQDQLMEIYRRLAQIDPRDPAYRLKYGLQLLRAAKPQEARREFLAAVALKPDVRSLNAAGVTYDMVGDRAGAQPYYRKALAMDPGYLPARGNLGLSLALAGDYPAAIALLEETTAMPQAGAEHRRMLATAYGLSGDMVSASRVAGAPFDSQSLAENLKRYGAVQ